MIETLEDQMGDTLDSRELEARLAELGSVAETCQECGEWTKEDDHVFVCTSEDCGYETSNPFEDDEELQEWKTLKEICAEGNGYFSDWQYGVQLIADHYFTVHAQEVAESIGATDREQSWPHTCIDWEQAARDLQMDYTSIEIKGSTYWGR